MSAETPPKKECVLSAARKLHQQYLQQEKSLSQLLNELVVCYLSNIKQDRDDAVEVLGSIAHPEAVRELIQMFQDCQWRTTRLLIVSVLGAHPSNRGIEFLIKLAKSQSDVPMSEAAIAALGSSRFPVARQFLASFYCYAPESHKAAVIRNLGPISNSTTNQKIFADLKSAYESGDKRRMKNLMASLGEIKSAKSLETMRSQFSEIKEIGLLESYLLCMASLSSNTQDIFKFKELSETNSLCKQIYKAAEFEISTRASFDLDILLSKALADPKNSQETIKEMSLFPEEAVVAKITDVFQVQNAKDVFQMAAHLTLPNMAILYESLTQKINLGRQLIFDFLESVQYHHSQQLEAVFINLQSRCFRDLRSPLFQKWFEAVSLCLPRTSELYKNFLSSEAFESADPEQKTIVINSIVTFCQVTAPNTQEYAECILILKSLLFNEPAAGIRARLLRALGQLEYLDDDILEFVKNRMHDIRVASSAIFLLERTAPPEGIALCLEVIEDNPQRNELAPSLLRALAAQKGTPPPTRALDRLLKRCLSKESTLDIKVLALQLLSKYCRKEFLVTVIACTQQDLRLQLAAVVALRNFADESAIEALNDALNSGSVAVAGRALDSLTQVPGMRAGLLVLENLEKNLNDLEMCEKVIRCFNLETGKSKIIHRAHYFEKPFAPYARWFYFSTRKVMQRKHIRKR